MYELVTICEQDVPSADPVTEMPFGLFVAYAVRRSPAWQGGAGSIENYTDIPLMKEHR